MSQLRKANTKFKNGAENLCMTLYRFFYFNTSNV